MIRNATFWTEARCSKLRRLYQANETDGEIARKLGRTKRAIAVQRAKLGLVSDRLKSRAGAVASFSTMTLVTELRRRGWTVKPGEERTLDSYTTGTLTAKLRNRGYSVRLTKIPR
jgi:hypothetical protein